MKELKTSWPQMRNEIRRNEIMRKFIITILMALMTMTAAMAKPFTEIVYETETDGVILYVDDTSYEEEFDSTIAYEELKTFEKYFVWNINEKKFDFGSARAMDIWIDTFGDLIEYAYDFIEDGYSTACLIFVAGGLENNPIKGTFAITNDGYMYGFWDY